jgi:hypothetical protein
VKENEGKRPKRTWRRKVAEEIGKGGKTWKKLESWP